MPAEALLAIDLGTTRLKVAAFDPDGSLLSLRARRNREQRAGERAWQSADDWWTDTVELVRELLSQPLLKERRILGVSLSGRAGAGVFLDGDGGVVAQPWSDRRHQKELRRLRDAEPLPGYAAGLIAKILWLRREEPRLFRSVRRALYAKDFLLYRLTGIGKTDWSSGPDGPAWDGRVLAKLDLDPALLPQPALPWEIAGGLTSRAAAEIGCPAGTLVAVGAHDGICANVGAGAGRPGAYAITLGTHGVVRAISEECPPGAFRFYVLPPSRHVIGGNALMAGRSLEWLVDSWLAEGNDETGSRFSRLDRESAEIPLGAEGVRFLPFLGGRVAPERRPGAAATFAGLRAEHGRAHLFRAVLEGTGFAIRDIFHQVRGWCGPPTVVGLTGGGARCQLWSQILADTLDQPIEVTDQAAEARGAAIYLAAALGLHPDPDAATLAMVRASRTFTPDSARVYEYQEVYRSWKRLLDATRPLDAS